MSANELTCPRCEHVLVGMMVFGAKLNRCDTCEGLWVPAAFVEALATKPEVRARLHPLAERASAQPPRPEPRGLAQPAACAECGTKMQRFAVATSRVTIDACKAHGTWFDKDELGKVLAFMQANPSATLRPPTKSEPPSKAKPRTSLKPAPKVEYSSEGSGEVAIGVVAFLLELFL